MNYKPISEEIEKIAKKVIDAAYVIHKELGPGLLEKVYEICFYYELSKRGIKFKRQVNIPIVYDGKMLDESFRIDVLIEDKIICEIKSVSEMNPVYEAHFNIYETNK